MTDTSSTRIPLTFLGTGSAFAPGRMWSGMLLDGRVLLDAPPTALPRLKELGVDMAELDGAFITHPHGDHFLGLPFLFLEYRMKVEHDDDFRVVCPVGMAEVLDRLDRMAYPGMADKYADRFTVEYVEVEPGDIGNIGDVRFRAFEMAHGGLKALGYLLEVRDRWIAYSGDTGPCEGLEDMVSESDAAIVEMAMTEEEFPGHMNLQRVLELRGRHPDVELWVTHLDDVSEGAVKTLEDAGVKVAEDMGRVEV